MTAIWFLSMIENQRSGVRNQRRRAVIFGPALSRKEIVPLAGRRWMLASRAFLSKGSGSRDRETHHSCLQKNGGNHVRPTFSFVVLGRIEFCLGKLLL
jgi:hypothetical protein